VNADEALIVRLRGFLEQRPLLGPETVHVDVANACDLACITCWNHAPDLAAPKSADWKGRRMSLALFERVSRELAAAGVERIILSGGGEPFAHPDIDTFIERTKALGLRLTVITNGTRCDFERLRRQGVDQVLLNIASATPATYAAYHGGKGADQDASQNEATFHRLVEGARRLEGRVNLVQVVNNVNFRELPEMVDLAADLGTRCSFKLGAVPPGTERHALSAGDRQELLTRLIPKARETARARRVKQNLDAFELHLEGEPRRLLEAPCFAGYLYSRISIDGTVFFCCENVMAGNVATQNFGDVWASAEYAELRRRIHHGERFPGCARCGKHDMNFGAALALEALRGRGDVP
jgi:MoaA/NifB/PqqE/SkfB family radical SAM enzyme